MNIRVGIQYIEAWLGGLGCVPLYNLMEDAATAEISRTQVWQWVHNPRGILEDGRKVTRRTRSSNDQRRTFAHPTRTRRATLSKRPFSPSHKTVFRRIGFQSKTGRIPYAES